MISQRESVWKNPETLLRSCGRSPDGVQIVDLNGYITYSNRAVEEMYGISQEELLGKHVNEMNVDPEFAGLVILPSIRETGTGSGN